MPRRAKLPIMWESNAILPFYWRYQTAPQGTAREVALMELEYRKEQYHGR